MSAYLLRKRHVDGEIYCQIKTCCLLSQLHSMPFVVPRHWLACISTYFEAIDESTYIYMRVTCMQYRFFFVSQSAKLDLKMALPKKWILEKNTK